jgi:hypothetical protein
MMFMDANRGEEAAERARLAARRVQELQERNKRLQAGEIPSAEEAARAKAAAEEEQRRSERARERARSAYMTAAKRHRDAAFLFDQTGHRDKAEQHRQAAARDDAAEEEHQGY